MSSNAASLNLKGKTIVLCFDGTDSQYGTNNTNVVNLFSLLKKDCPDRQVSYYQAGIGTFVKPGVVSPLFQQFAKNFDGAVAWYLDTHVKDGYQFLMQNYNAGDKICLFGFSRGAYTARALGGMLFKVGLLSRDNDDQISFAYNLFTRTDNTSVKLSAGFKRTFCQDVKVEFMGVWDTVASVGIIAGRSLPFVNSNMAITTFRQALSLDERRAKFRPNLYHRPTPTSRSPTFDPNHPTPTIANYFSSLFSRRRSKGRPNVENSPKHQPVSSSTSALDVHKIPVDALEVWFSGCHSDVGGGSVPDTTNRSLSQITLRWMVREIAASQCGILFDEEQLAHMSIPLSRPEKSGSTSAERVSEDDVDALEPIYDQLARRPLWWLLELVPLHYIWQGPNNLWHKSFTINRGQGRIIGEQNPKFHITVRQRMDNASLNYKPKAIWPAGTEVYVD